MSTRHYAQCRLRRKRHDGNFEETVGWLEVDDILKCMKPFVTLKNDDGGPWEVVNLSALAIT